MKLIDKIKNNRNVVGLIGACLINDILYMFLNTFMVAYFITLTNYDYKLISIYYILSFVGILITFLILAKTIKNRYQVIIFRSGIVHYLLETLITILIVMTFKTTLSLGILTTIFSVCSMISIYIFQYKLKSNKKVLKVSSIAMIISVFYSLLI